jgi:hypothetical protein
MKYTKEYLTELVKNSKCVWDVIAQTGMSKQEGNYRYIKAYLTKYKIDISHFENQFLRPKRMRSLNEYLVKGEYLTLNGNRLKGKLYKAGLKKRECEECGQGEDWRGKKFSLILDHIDGDRENNTIENLRIVCPNCNACLDTHCRKKKK